MMIVPSPIWPYTARDGQATAEGRETRTEKNGGSTKPGGGFDQGTFDAHACGKPIEKSVTGKVPRERGELQQKAVVALQLHTSIAAVQ